MTDEIPRSAVFDTDEKYEKQLRNSIAILEHCVLMDEDVVIESPMATRILLDFYYETLRKHLEYGRERKEDSMG